MYSVFIEDDDYGIHRMFSDKGWSIVYKPEDADYIVFSGGTDINPALYGEEVHKTVMFDSHRDADCVDLYKKSRELGKKLIGICRGAQFLNVMNGGKLYQHVNNHGRDHALLDVETNKEVVVTSIHHQMMRPAENAKLIAYAYGQSTQREHMINRVVRADLGPDKDAEVVWYDNCLCFQPHPEYHQTATHDYFFELIDRLF